MDCQNGVAECEVGKFSSVNETLSPLFYIGRFDGMLTICPVKEVMLSPFRVVCWYVMSTCDGPRNEPIFSVVSYFVWMT